MKSRRTPPVCSHMTKERFSGRCIFGQHYKYSSRSRSEPPKTTKPTLRIIRYHILVSCCTNPKKQKNTHTRLVLVCTLSARTAVKILLGYKTGKKQIQRARWLGRLSSYLLLINQFREFISHRVHIHTRRDFFLAYKIDERKARERELGSLLTGLFFLRVLLKFPQNANQARRVLLACFMRLQRSCI